MSKILNGGLDLGGAINPLNSSNLEQLALKGLTGDKYKRTLMLFHCQSNNDVRTC